MILGYVLECTYSYRYGSESYSHLLPIEWQNAFAQTHPMSDNNINSVCPAANVQH
jgi:hypothetical protein